MEKFKIGPSMGETMKKEVEHEYNLLTKRLLAEGYSAENYPDYVKIPSGYYNEKNPLQNFYGGFEYTRKAINERVYETPCGLLCLGKSAFGGMTWMGVNWEHENDCPVTGCPHDYVNCAVRPEPFASIPVNGACAHHCPVHPTTRPYEYEGSLEQVSDLWELQKEAARLEFLEKHKNACEAQIRFDNQKARWYLRYNPDFCIDHGKHCGFCKCLQKPLGTAVGNIYYDIEIEGRDTSKDGTIFEGERFHKVYKGFQFYDKPVNLVWAEAALKVNKDLILHLIRVNKMPRLVDSMTLYFAEKGEVDLHWEIKNFRVVKRNVRDIDQDLADIDAGISITHVLDETKRVKEAKQEKRKKASMKRLDKLRKKVLTKELDEYEVARAMRKLGEDEYYRLLDEKEQAPVQLTIFDTMDVAAGD